MARFPNWVGGLSELEREFTIGEWVDELMVFEAQPVDYVWLFVKEALNKNPSPFPPGITEITAHIRRAIWAEAKRQEQDKESKLLSDERGKDRCQAPKEFQEMTAKLVQKMEKHKISDASDILGKKTQLNDEEWAEWEKGKK